MREERPHPALPVSRRRSRTCWLSAHCVPAFFFFLFAPRPVGTASIGSPVLSPGAGQDCCVAGFRRVFLLFLFPGRWDRTSPKTAPSPCCRFIVYLLQWRRVCLHLGNWVSQASLLKDLIRLHSVFSIAGTVVAFYSTLSCRRLRGWVLATRFFAAAR